MQLHAALLTAQQIRASSFRENKVGRIHLRDYANAILSCGVIFSCAGVPSLFPRHRRLLAMSDAVFPSFYILNIFNHIKSTITFAFSHFHDTLPTK